jgi:hypothetical protein
MGMWGCEGCGERAIEGDIGREMAQDVTPSHLKPVIGSDTNSCVGGIAHPQYEMRQ